MKEKFEDTGPTPEPTAALAPTVPEQQSKPKANEVAPLVPATAPPKTEYGGPKGLEPTRYGDWELFGRCIDF